jgi:GrpB-like predicted nucleotidyltransferase (UPF0157 family)
VKELSVMTLEELWQLFPIELVEHNPAWFDWYLEEKTSLLAALGSVVKDIDHIGSTSVDDLIAKPIVDILLQVTPECDFAWLKSTLLDNGWLLMSEVFVPDLQLDWNKGYTPEGFAQKVFHLHVRHTGDWDEPYFRDYLCNHPAIAMEYAALKQKLSIEYKFNRDAYTDGKGEFVRWFTKQARVEKEGKET